MNLNVEKKYSLNVVENYYNLNIEKILSNKIIKENDIFFPILNNGVIYPTNKSNHFLIPLLLSKKVLETKNIFVYDKVYDCFVNDLNGTGRFFEALSTENFTLENKILVISFGEETQHFGQVFAIGLQNVDYIHINENKNIIETNNIKNYNEIIFYVNELTQNHKLIEVINNIQKETFSANIVISCILNYTKNISIPIISLLTLDLKTNNENRPIGLYKSYFPYHNNSKINPVINNNAKQDDNLIETIMTIMSSQDFIKTNKKIKVLFLSDDDFSYIPMLISEFMSGFDTYDIYFSKITKMKLDIFDKITIINKDNSLSYIYNITKDTYEFMFYITNKEINYDNPIFESFKDITNIQNINIITKI